MLATVVLTAVTGSTIGAVAAVGLGVVAAMVCVVIIIGLLLVGWGRDGSSGPNSNPSAPGEAIYRQAPASWSSGSHDRRCERMPAG